VKAGIPKVAMICENKAKLEKIKAAILAGLDADMASRVEYWELEPFIVHLNELPVMSQKKEEKMSHGYKLKSSKPTATMAKQKVNESGAVREIAELMKPKKR
jgi:hypothetical protein